MSKITQSNKERLPNSWQNSTIGEISTYIQRGKSPKYAAKSQYPVINQKAIRWSGIEEQHLKYIQEDTISTWGSERIVQAGDVLWNSTGTGTIGRACIASEPDTEKPIYVDSHVTIVRAYKDFIDPRYLFNWIKNPSVQRKIDELSTGTTNQIELNKSTVAETHIPIAPLNEQRRIADKLDTTLAAVEACKQKLQSANETIQRFRQSVLAAAVSGELTREWREERGIDRGDWKSTTFGKACSQITVGFVGKMSDQYKEKGIPFLRSMNIKPFRLKEDGILYISSEFHEKIIKSRLLPGDLAVVRTGEPGQCCVIPDSLPEANCSDLVVLRPGGELIADFGAIAINSSAVKQFVDSEKVGVAQAHFNVGSMKITPLELPSLEEQTAISKLVADFQKTADEIQEVINKNQEILTKLTKSLLAKAFRGELVPQDPNDEPASVLLERIKAQREAEAATKKPAKRARKKKTDAAQLGIPEGIADNHLAKVLEECGALSERALLAASELEPGVFQLQLSKELKADGLKQVDIDGEAAYADAAWEE